MGVDESTDPQVLPLVVGIDLGGTQIRVAVLQGTHMHARVAVLTGDDPTPERVLPRVYAALQQALDQANMTLDECAGIGVASPGPLDNRTGVVYSPPNLLSWNGFPLRDTLKEKYQKPVFVENDANAAALGEYMFGAGQGSQDMVYITVSTGIGGGVVVNGRLLEGANGSAGEIGHMIIDWHGSERCSCGNIGCLEALASGTAIARQANRAIANGQGAELLAFARTMLEHTSDVPDRSALPHYDFRTQPLDKRDLAGSDLPEAEVKMTAKMVALAASAGIPLARAIITDAAEALGIGLVNVLHIYSPEILILGGGVMQTGAMLLEPALRVVQQHAMRANLSDAHIVSARLGSDVGLIGAGALLPYYQRLAVSEAV